MLAMRPVSMERADDSFFPLRAPPRSFPPTPSTVKLNPDKTSSRRKMRKAHFGATSVERRARMSCALSEDLWQRHKVRTVAAGCVFS